MMFRILLIGLGLLAALTHAQVIDWHEQANQVWVYEISDKEAIKLLKGEILDKNIPQLLHTQNGKSVSYRAWEM
jgi:hypothetical protein